MSEKNFAMPYGGKLVNRIFKAEKEEVDKLEKELENLELSDKEESDLELIASGAYSPLLGFMLREDYESVVEKMELSSNYKNLIWSIPITLSIDEGKKEKISEGDALFLSGKRLKGVIEVEEIYEYDKKREAEKVFKTKEKAHPGVGYLFENQGNYLVGGKVKVFEFKKLENFEKYHLTPEETRKEFKKRAWQSIVAFQTRNPLHRAHEYMQKCALEIVDGLFIHPLVGYTKDDDIPADVRMRCYEAIVENYYPKERVFISIFPAAMRYAGPREAVLHAIARKNYGATHFIVGRDHAGVGSYYKPFEAQTLLRSIGEENLGIRFIFYDMVFYCRKCESMSSNKTCPHGEEYRVKLSGTQVRKMLTNNESLPKEFTRPEVAEILRKYYRGELK